jgi:hypothetical protein
MPFRTLGSLRADLLARLGMGAMGASGGANQSLMDSLLRDAQLQLYRKQDWKHLQDYHDTTTGIGQNLYDYPTAGTMDTATGCALYKRVLRVETNVSGQFVEIREGITTSMWSTMDTQGQPQRFERFKQVMIYPKANAAYTLRFWFVADMKPLTQENDVCTLDDEMVLLHAVANGKAHYRQPDAPIYAEQLKELLAHIRSQSFTSDGVVRRTDDAELERRPLVVGRDV